MSAKDANGKTANSWKYCRQWIDRVEPLPCLEFRVYAVRRTREIVRKWDRLKAGLQTGGAWIFISHSHRDLEKIRRIRNELERRGHNPFLFFLKCLEVGDARLPELIRDEIKARTFFVLCNTRASRRSQWVKQEIELVKQVTKRSRKTVELMNLERDL